MRIRFLLLLMLAAVLKLQAESVWTLTTDAGRDVAVSQIEYMLSVDGSDHFSIVLTGGEVVNDVTFATFAKKSGIDETHSPYASGMLLEQVSDILTIKGCADNADIEVYSLGGQLLLHTTASSGMATLNVSPLSPGCYILKAGETAVKFTKK